MKLWQFRQPMFDADGGGGAVAAPAASSVEPSPAPVNEPASAPQTAESVSAAQKVKDLWDKANEPQPNPTPVDTPAPQAPAGPDNPAVPAQPQKIMNKYDSVGDLVKAHQSLQTTYNKEHVALSEASGVIEKLRADNANLEAKLQQQTANSNPQQPQAPAQPTDEFAGLDAEGILEKLYADPLGVLTRIAEKVAESKVRPLEGRLSPVIEERETLDAWGKAVDEFVGENPEFTDYVDSVKGYIAENNLGDSKEPGKVITKGFINALKSKVTELSGKVIDPETLLKDEAFLKRITSDPAIREAILKEHMASVRTNQSQIPNTISGNSNTGAPATPPLSLKGKPMSEVHTAASNFLFGNR